MDDKLPSPADLKWPAYRFATNMADWCAEKAGRVVEELEQVHRLLAEQALPLEVAEQVRDHLAVAMRDATKLVSYGSAKEWTPQDANFILKNGERGLRVYAARHRILSGELSLKALQRRDHLDTFVKELEELLDPNDRANNRTRVHELVRKFRTTDPLIVDVDDCIERVTQGEITWDEGIKGMRRAIEDWNDRLRQELASFPAPPSSWTDVDAHSREGGE